MVDVQAAGVWKKRRVGEDVDIKQGLLNYVVIVETRGMVMPLKQVGQVVDQSGVVNMGTEVERMEIWYFGSPGTILGACA